MLDLNAEHGRRSATFSAYRERTVPVAVGYTLVCEARFKGRGYERGARFTITKMTSTTWTIVHDAASGAKEREETLSVKDPALSFTVMSMPRLPTALRGKPSAMSSTT